jgi:hypothetical protein
MCCSRTPSPGGGKLYLSLIEDGLSEVTAEISSRAEIDFPADDIGEFPFKRRHLEETDLGVGEKFDQHVDITVGAESVVQSGSE